MNYNPDSHIPYILHFVCYIKAEKEEAFSEEFVFQKREISIEKLRVGFQDQVKIN